jgi:ABC-type nitrate/sulfonate/bicarbonate transport system permease component
MSKFPKKAVPSLTVLLMLTVIWECLGAYGSLQEAILPRPSLILVTLIRHRSLLWHHSVVTLSEAFIGFVIACLLAFLLGLLMDNITILKNALHPFLVVSQTIPIITLAPLFVIWFGYGWMPKVVVVVMVCFFPVVINFLHGMDHVDQDMITLMRTMKAGKYAIFRLVKLPHSLPYLFSGIKISASYAVMGAVIGEWLGAKDGLGEYMRRSMKAFAVEQTFASIVIISVVSLLWIWILDKLEIALMPWEKKENTEEE